MLVAGVDGCPGGWIVVRASVGSGTPELLLPPTVYRTFLEVLEGARDCAVIGVDIPIGLSPDDYWRAADRRAKQVIGSRGSSVFPAPLRATLSAQSWEEARDISVGICGKAMTIYAYGLLKKVREVDEALPLAQEGPLLIEVHPEVSFWAMNETIPLRYGKKSDEGKLERLQLLDAAFTHGASNLVRPARAAWDDLYDACAAAWTAARFARGEAGRLPEDPPLDSRGLRMEIVY